MGLPIVFSRLSVQVLLSMIRGIVLKGLILLACIRLLLCDRVVLIPLRYQ